MFKEKCCKQRRHFKFKGTITKRLVQKQTHRTAQKHVNAKTNQTLKMFLCFSDFSFLIFSCMIY